MARLEGTARYGKFYWCIKVPANLSEDGEIYVMADEMQITPTGDLVAIGGGRTKDDEPPKERYPVLALSFGQWQAFYAASCLDGSAIAVERWKGEVVR